jgi:hypothetical protein
MLCEDTTYNVRIQHRKWGYKIGPKDTRKFEDTRQIVRKNIRE